jgi:hypothetical protein
MGASCNGSGNVIRLISVDGRSAEDLDADLSEAVLLGLATAAARRGEVADLRALLAARGFGPKSTDQLIYSIVGRGAGRPSAFSWLHVQAAMTDKERVILRKKGIQHRRLEIALDRAEKVWKQTWKERLGVGSPPPFDRFAVRNYLSRSKRDRC